MDLFTRRYIRGTRKVTYAVFLHLSASWQSGARWKGNEQVPRQRSFRRRAPKVQAVITDVRHGFQEGMYRPIVNGQVSGAFAAHVQETPAAQSLR